MSHPHRQIVCTARRFGVLLVAAAAFTGQATAGEWPQILGPTRNGKASSDERLATRWPKDGPATLWEREIGSGYAGVAVAKGRVVLFHRIGDEAVCEALDRRSGKQLWKASFPTHYQSGIAPDEGPRCVPLIHEAMVYLCGADGDLHCLRLESGEKVWSRDTFHDFKPPAGYFGAGSTPIIEGDKLLMNVGAKGAGIVAFALADGRTAWKATDEAASYSAPTAAELDGERQVVFVARLNVVGIDPANGAERFRFPFGMRGPTVNAATPLVLGDALFVSASYGIGARMVQIAKGKVNTLWASDGVMASQYTTSVEHDGTLFGIDGRQDQGIARLRAFDPRTGNVFWTQEGFGTGNLILAGDKLLVMKTDGELVLVDPLVEEYRPLETAKIFETTVQALPALADGLLYARDTRTLKCVAVGDRTVAAAQE